MYNYNVIIIIQITSYIMQFQLQHHHVLSTSTMAHVPTCGPHPVQNMNYSEAQAKQNAATAMPPPHSFSTRLLDVHRANRTV